MVGCHNWGAISHKQSWLVKGLTNSVLHFPPPPPCPLLSYAVELLLRPDGNLFFFLFFFWWGGLGGADSRGTDSPPPLQRIQFPPLVTAVNTPKDGWLPGSCMRVIRVLVSFFPSEVGGRARAQGFNPTLPRATQMRTINI